MAKVILTGATGLIGSELQHLLQQNSYETAVLSRKPQKPGQYKWSVENGYIDSEAFDNAQAIIHLAGAPIADKAWTEDRKKEIISSRVESAELLFRYLANHTHNIRTFISASAVGYYGNGGDTLLTEDSPNGQGFLADVCRQWENAADQFGDLGLRVCKVRTGIVLSREGGVLPQMDLPLKFGLGTTFGDGRPYMPWIHIKDICRIYLYLLQNENCSGPYNSCAPDPATNKEMTKAIARALKRPNLPVAVPAFILKTVLGERSELLLDSSRCSPEKIRQSGFSFRFTDLGVALRDIYQNK